MHLHLVAGNGQDHLHLAPHLVEHVHAERLVQEGLHRAQVDPELLRGLGIDRLRDLIGNLFRRGELLLRLRLLRDVPVGEFDQGEVGETEFPDRLPRIEGREVPVDLAVVLRDVQPVLVDVLPELERRVRILHHVLPADEPDQFGDLRQGEHAHLDRVVPLRSRQNR
ncbi:UNVERIFIED_CONTAM: hypothetical protein PYX00_009512 [Menopon gallinae]|uniref:Uncharacterized protein n=1 Tax=Menopon gallinae TaxID=328185 RepID=A0AAW2HBQ5_9NEOP